MTENNTGNGVGTLNSVNFQIELLVEDATQSEEQAQLADALSVSLSRNGYDVSAKRSGSVLDVVGYMAQNATQNKELLLVLFESAKVALQLLFKEHEKRAAKEKPTQPSKISLTLELDGAPVTIEVSDLETAEKLLQKVRTTQPQAVSQASKKSKLKAKAKISK